MTLTGLQCAIVIKELAEYLDRDAHDVLRSGLEPYAREGLDHIGRGDIADNEFAVRSVANWMARVPSAAGWTHRAQRRSTDSRTTETRIPRELSQLDLDANAIARLTQFMAERTQRDRTAERLITARQRRRNINSQTRQMVKPLDMGWLDGHLDRALPSWRQDEILDTAHRLSTQLISEPIDIERWREEVPKFRADFISADAAESPRHRDSSSGGATARTYRASWTKFWRDNDLARVFMQLMYEDNFVAGVQRMLAEEEEGDIHIRVPIRRPGADEMLRFPVLSTSYRGSAPIAESSVSEARFFSPEQFMRTSNEPLDSKALRAVATQSSSRQPETFLSPTSATSERILADKVRFDFHPQGQPGNTFTRTWSSVEVAEAAVARFLDATLRMAVASDLWDFTVALQTDSGTVSINRAGQTSEQMKIEAARLISQIESLA